MEDMKSLKAIIVCISLLWCSQAHSDSKSPLDLNLAGGMPIPVFLGDDIRYSMPHYLWKSSQYMWFRLSKTEKKQHQSAVYFVLNNAQNGEIVTWHSEKRTAIGQVRVIHSYPISGGYCRQYQSLIRIKGKTRHMTNNACRYDTAIWYFYK